MTDPEDRSEPEILPGPLRDIQLQLDRLKTDVEFQEAHIKSSIELYHQLLEEMKEFWPRLEMVERKTFSISAGPIQKNCPHCHRKMANPKARKCSICGHDVFQ